MSHHSSQPRRETKITRSEIPKKQFFCQLPSSVNSFCETHKKLKTKKGNFTSYCYNFGHWRIARTIGMKRKKRRMVGGRNLKKTFSAQTPTKKSKLF